MGQIFAHVRRTNALPLRDKVSTIAILVSFVPCFRDKPKIFPLEKDLGSALTWMDLQTPEKTPFPEGNIG